jgi:hypothetical protein
MDGAIPLLLLFVSTTWTGTTLTVVKKHGVTRNHVIWTAGHQTVNTKTWIQQQGIRIESLIVKDVSLLDYFNFLHQNNSHNVSHLSITAK